MLQPFRSNVAVALIHYPVVDKNGLEIASAITPTDLHDLARAARTYGVSRYYVVSPLVDQRKLANSMLGFWNTGVGADYNPNRGQALDLVRVVDSLDDAIEDSEAANGQRPAVWATSAGENEQRLDYGRAVRILRRGEPVMVLFGTAWGLAPSVMKMCDQVLAQISGVAGPDGQAYNHLSVRSAAAITLDRLLGQKQGE